MHAKLLERIRTIFAADLESLPAMTLRAGDAVDSGRPAMPFDSVIDRVTDEYITSYGCGVYYLDASSWRHYLPSLAEYALRHLPTNCAAVGAFLTSLRPPDAVPPRLASLDPEQEAMIRQILEVLAFTPESAWQEEACQALEEWWMDNARYRS